MDLKICKACGTEMVKLITNPIAEMYICPHCMNESCVKNAVNLSKCPMCGRKTLAQVDNSNNEDFYDNVKKGVPSVTHICVSCGAVGGFNFGGK